MAQQDDETTQARVNGPSATSRTENIYPILYVEKIRASHRIEALYSTHMRKAKFRSTPTINALRESIFSLRDDAERRLREAHKDGRLLMCWEGSRVTELLADKEATA